MATFEKKQNYIVHYSNLQQAIENGLIVDKENILKLVSYASGRLVNTYKTIIVLDI